MVDHLKDLHGLIHELAPLGGMSAETVEYVDREMSLRELRESLPKVHEMSGDDIRRLRDKHHLSQAMLAEYLNMKTGTISKWERGEKKPNGAALRVLLEIDRKGQAAFIE